MYGISRFALGQFLLLMIYDFENWTMHVIHIPNFNSWCISLKHFN